MRRKAFDYTLFNRTVSLERPAPPYVRRRHGDVSCIPVRYEYLVMRVLYTCVKCIPVDSCVVLYCRDSCIVSYLRDVCLAVPAWWVCLVVLAWPVYQLIDSYVFFMCHCDAYIFILYLSNGCNYLNSVSLCASVWYHWFTLPLRHATPQY